MRKVTQWGQTKADNSSQLSNNRIESVILIKNIYQEYANGTRFLDGFCQKDDKSTKTLAKPSKKSAHHS